MNTEINYKHLLERAIDAAWFNLSNEHSDGDDDLPHSTVDEVVNMLVGSNGELTLEDAVWHVFLRDILGDDGRCNCGPDCYDNPDAKDYEDGDELK